ncbi:MAG TPA: protein kinase [Polyangiaceae bacterium]|nr:protein kinase [Polyangiaceae bacterium]
MVAPGSPLDEDAQGWPGCPLQIGQVLAGKYRIEQQIGRGGMGIVLSATHLQLEHRVAIKVMRRDLLEDDKALHRLLAEARASAKIRSEHVARVLDVGTLENGFPFIVMEYLEGEDLADLLDRQGALEVEQAVQFLMQSCEALAEVHAAEMIHRDLKPGNLFITKLPDGSPSLKIVDFGISKNIGGSARGRAATTSTQVLGSPYYMPPEQMRAEPVDERSDIWSLGAILFEMLTGRPPFLGETLPEVYAAVLGKPAPSIETLRPSVPAGLDDVVQRCLDKDPAQRFCDVADLAEALAPFGGANSAQSVEKITRILTNPDLVRARASNPPRASSVPRPPQPELSAGAREEPPVEPQPLLVVGVGTAPGFGPGLAPPLFAQPAAAARSTGELGPLSATGSLEDSESRGSSRPRLAWAAVAGAVVLVGIALWNRTSEMGPSGPATQSLPVVTSSQPETPGGGAARSGATTRVSAVPERDEQSPAQKGGRENARQEDSALSTRQHSLQPAAPVVAVDNERTGATSRRKAEEKKSSEKRTKSRASARKAPTPTLAASAERESAELDRPAPDAPEAAPATPPAPSPAPAVRRTDSAREEDPWNPSSFGDRR